jgi:hypothetical protein
LEDEHDRVKKAHSIDNALLIVADLDSEDLITRFEERLNSKPDIFSVHSLQKYKELAKEDDDKKKKNKS